MVRWLILSALLLTSCKAAKPEMISLGVHSDETSKAPTPTNAGNGQLSMGSDPNVVNTGTMNIQGHVSTVPVNNSNVTANFKVRARVHF
jgi:hypothetical protein